jgi:hypothetical protein
MPGRRSREERRRRHCRSGGHRRTTVKRVSLVMPLSTLLFRVRRLERRGHAERLANPDDGRSYLIRLTPAGKQLLNRARPAFRAKAAAVEARLGKREVAALREALSRFREAVDAVEQRPVARKRGLGRSG